MVKGWARISVNIERFLLLNRIPPMAADRMDRTDATQTGMVALLIVAAVLIIGFLLFFLNVFPNGQVRSEEDQDINIDAPEELQLPDVEPPQSIFNET